MNSNTSPVSLPSNDELAPREHALIALAVAAALGQAQAWGAAVKHAQVQGVSAALTEGVRVAVSALKAPPPAPTLSGLLAGARGSCCG